jgi:hypothetical protein
MTWASGLTAGLLAALGLALLGSLPVLLRHRTNYETPGNAMNG